MTVIFSEARASLADLFDAAIRHVPTRIARRRSGEAVLISREDLMLLVRRYGFSPAVYFEPEAVSIWLPELAIWGRGSAFEEARDDLIDEVRQYVAEFVDDERMRQAPNHVSRTPWVIRALLTDDDAELAEAIFAEPDGDLP
jgi:hypothetical protein